MIVNSGKKILNKVEEYRRNNQKWTIQRNWQHRVHTTKKNKTKTTQYVLDTIIRKQTTNNVNKTKIILTQAYVTLVNTVVSNHVNSDHVPSFSCLDVWISRQTTSGVYAIIVTTSAYHSRRCGRLQVIVIWRRRVNRWINTAVRYPTICLISEIYT